MRNLLAACLLAACASATVAGASTTYVIDPNHTFPSFAADHMGISVWRGKFNRTTGTVTYDAAANTGNVDILVDVASVDFGLDTMNDKALSGELFDVAKFPDAKYVGKLADFVNGAPTRVDGELTLRGVTRPVDLEILSFKCVPHPLNKRELCGADAVGTFKRDEFGMEAGKAYGFSMDVTMQIQVEALKSE